MVGELLGWDPVQRRLRVRFQKWWQPAPAPYAEATFALDPFAVVTSTRGLMPSVSELRPGLPVRVAYTTGAGGRPCATSVVFLIDLHGERLRGSRPDPVGPGTVSSLPGGGGS
jgi:hypothetical protein